MPRSRGLMSEVSLHWGRLFLMSEVPLYCRWAVRVHRRSSRTQAQNRGTLLIRNILPPRTTIGPWA